MLTYMALDWDNQAARSAKLKALADYYHQPDFTAFKMLGADVMAPTKTGGKQKLIINSHGNANVFAGYSPESFLTQLMSKGFAEGSFPEIYLMACKVGEASQDNSIITNFARDLKRLLVGHGITAKLYAPRGILTYSLERKQASGQTYYTVTEMFIKAPERNYPLDEGMLLIT